MNIEELRSKIGAEVSLLAGKPVEDADLDVFSTDILDSLNILHIITFAETEFGLTIEPMEINYSNFSTINQMARFIHDKLHR